MHLRRRLWPAIVALTVMVPARAAAPEVVATILPVHSLVAAVTDGVTTPVLLLEGNASPHSHALKPSQARALQSADLVVWVGVALETFLHRNLHDAASASHVLTLLELPTVQVLAAREGGRFEAHHHARSAGKDGEPAHRVDPHIWLDPDNALAVVDAVTAALVRLDAGNAQAYQDNAARARSRITELDVELRRDLAPISAAPYLVFHDAYQAFERHYGLRASGAVTLDPQRTPGAARVRALRHQIQEQGIGCVFREPQFEPRLVATLIAGTGARVGVLDPMGSELTPGPDAWFHLMRNLASALATCLSQP